ncbi:MAG: hypothetical protein ACRDP9_14635 [Kribbellaceae bacterium]
MATVIRVDHLRKAYGSVAAVDGVSFEVGGEFFGMSTPMRGIVAAAAPIMKAAGFKKRRPAFNRPVADGLVHVANFQWVRASSGTART